MLQYNDSSNIAFDVLAKLNIPEDIYLTWDDNDLKEFENKFNDNNELSYITSLVDEAMQNYDTSDNVPSDIEDIRQRAIDEVFWGLEEIVDAYHYYQAGLVDKAYESIVSTLKNANLTNVVEVDSEYDGPDPDVGIFGEERRIIFTLSNGKYISFVVEDYGE